ncbi:hypothetical protein Patl1_01107 [Pistacia atlantica]|uniref:Uncharacterized protein n=1 Tax=Pistacia atlantica TaxID=434234 RepID=A0ACC1C8N6_9ROSI|nr:hypothetical protein Patl1_01107 [Pistacia atlantica]
MPVAVTPKI